MFVCYIFFLYLFIIIIIIIIMDKTFYYYSWSIGLLTVVVVKCWMLLLLLASDTYHTHTHIIQNFEKNISCNVMLFVAYICCCLVLLLLLLLNLSCICSTHTIKFFIRMTRFSNKKKNNTKKNEYSMGFYITHVYFIFTVFSFGWLFGMMLELCFCCCWW